MVVLHINGRLLVRGVRFGDGALHSQNAVSDMWYHVQLLEHRVHVAGGAPILQAHETVRGARSNWR